MCSGTEFQDSFLPRFKIDPWPAWVPIFDFCGTTLDKSLQRTVMASSEGRGRMEVCWAEMWAWSRFRFTLTKASMVERQASWVGIANEELRLYPRLEWCWCLNIHCCMKEADCILEGNTHSWPMCFIRRLSLKMKSQKIQGAVRSAGSCDRPFCSCNYLSQCVASIYKCDK